MRVTLRSKNLEITPSLAEYIERKILKPSRKFLQDEVRSGLPVLDLEFSRITKHHKKGKVYYAEANLSLGKKVFRAEVYGYDIREVCDLLEEELERGIKKIKGKASAQYKRGARRIKRDTRYAADTEIKPGLEQ